MKNFFKTSIYSAIIFILLLYNSCVFREVGFIKKNSISNTDVYFVGASGIQTGIIPLRIYNKSGITNENINVANAQFATDYYIVKQNIKVNKPKIIFLDAETIFEKKEKEKKDLLHYLIDQYPLNASKIAFVNQKIYNMCLDEKISFIFPFFRFHDRWKEINFSSFFCQKSKSYKHGVSIFTKIIDKKYLKLNYMQKNEEIDEIRNILIENQTEKYLNKINSLCKKNKIDLILLVLPRQNWSLEKHQLLEIIAKKEGLKVIDMNIIAEEINFDQKMDLYNDNHCNISGAIKASDYITYYINQNYNLPSHRGEPKYKQWDKDLEEYKKHEKIWLDEYNKNLQKQQLK